MSDPLQLTPLERHVDSLLRFENFERYRTQSAMGVLPAREPVQQYDPGRPPEIIAYADRRGI